MRSFVVLLALLLAPVAVAASQPGPVDYGPLPTLGGFQPATVSRVEPRFSRAAARVAGGLPVEARCWSTADWRNLRVAWLEATRGTFDLATAVSYVNPNDPEPQSRVHLSPSICTLLGRVTYKRAWRTTTRRLDLARAVVTLAHEAQHIRGTSDEPTAECHGLQRARYVARALGLTAAEAEALVSLYWRREYSPYHPRFGSTECRQGGALDLDVSRSFP